MMVINTLSATLTSSPEDSTGSSFDIRPQGRGGSSCRLPIMNHSTVPEDRYIGTALWLVEKCARTKPAFRTCKNKLRLLSGFRLRVVYCLLFRIECIVLSLCHLLSTFSRSQTWSVVPVHKFQVFKIVNQSDRSSQIPAKPMAKFTNYNLSIESLCLIIWVNVSSSVLVHVFIVCFNLAQLIIF